MASLSSGSPIYRTLRAQPEPSLQVLGCKLINDPN
jgi:hypothetical protein